jgi:5-methylcytosine-specific restriction endonuclease McrA
VTNRYLAPSTKERIFSRDGYVCMYCEGLANVIDHIIPYVYSQNNEDENFYSKKKKHRKMAQKNSIKGFYLR